MPHQSTGIILGAVGAVLLTACAAPPTGRESAPATTTPATISTFPYVETGGGGQGEGAELRGASQVPARRAPLIRMGTGTFVGAPPAALAGEGGAGSLGGDVTLNFESADLQEVVKTIFEDILKENYQLDPEVRGLVTMHTTMPVSRDSVLPILESILQTNGATMIRAGGMYKVVPLTSVKPSLAAPTFGRTPGGAGYGLQIVPLQYVAAAELKKILDPFVVEPTQVQIDETRNVVMLSGPRMSVNNLIETIKVFDVDWFQGKSFGLFPVEYADVEKLSEEIALVLDVGDEAALARIIKFIPIQRLNALLVVTHQPKHLKMVADLVEYFDRGTQAGPGQRLFVYNLQHAEAEAVAETLDDIFGGSDAKRRSSARAGAGLRGRGIRGGSALGGAGGGLSSPGSIDTVPVGGTAPALEGASIESSASLGIAARDVAARGDGEATGRGAISIKADAKNNALIVLASPADYRAVESAIAKLDVPARQVLIEASIAEVTLTNNMRYGIRWFFEWGAGGYGMNVGFGEAQNNSGLNIAIFNGADELRLLFDILEAETTVRFLSAPQVVVVDNETANFRVGDQIPIITRASQSTISPDAPLVSEVEYKDTGTLLSVKPRINAGGAVTLTISQEVSVPGTAAAGSNPPIAQRTIDSTVVVQSGQTVMLGGLIRETKNKSESGVPGLKDVPLLGGLFKTRTDDAARSELIVTVTPRVIKNPYEYQLATDDLRRRVKQASDLDKSVRLRPPR